MEQFIDAMMPIVVQIAVVLASAAVAGFAEFARRKLHLDITEAERAAIQAVLVRGIKAGVTNNLSGAALAEFAAAYAQTTSPDLVHKTIPGKSADAAKTALACVADALMAEAPGAINARER